MATTAAERQAKYRQKHRGRLRRLEVFVSNQTFWRIHEIAETTGSTVREVLAMLVEGYKGLTLPGNQKRKNANTKLTPSHARARENHQGQAPAEAGPPKVQGKDLDAVFKIVDDFKELGVSLSFGQALEIWRERQGPE